jgi:hypothetical protein
MIPLSEAEPGVAARARATRPYQLQPTFFYVKQY